jgi:hypothetical protein
MKISPDAQPALVIEGWPTLPPEPPHRIERQDSLISSQYIVQNSILPSIIMPSTQCSFGFVSPFRSLRNNDKTMGLSAKSLANARNRWRGRLPGELGVGD